MLTTGHTPLGLATGSPERVGPGSYVLPTQVGGKPSAKSGTFTFEATGRGGLSEPKDGPVTPRMQWHGARNKQGGRDACGPQILSNRPNAILVEMAKMERPEPCAVPPAEDKLGPTHDVMKCVNYIKGDPFSVNIAADNDTLPDGITRRTPAMNDSGSLKQGQAIAPVAPQQQYPINPMAEGGAGCRSIGKQVQLKF